MDMKECKEIYNYCFTDKFEIEDIENRHIYLNGSIGGEDISSIDVVSTTVYHILRYNKLDKDKPIEDRKPIYIYINSPGGSCYRWLCTY